MPAELRVIESDTYDVVAKLEDMLTKAKAGHIRSLAVAAMMDDGFCTCYTVQGANSKAQMIGALHHVIHRMHRRMDEEE